MQEGREPQPSAGIIDSQSVKGADTVGRDSRGKSVNALNRIINHLDPHSPNWTDGRPQILDNSTQDTDFGVVRNEDKDFERDPAVLSGGWRTLIDRKGSAESQLRGHTPVVFWEMNSTAGTDATFPILPDYKHGGNGAIFFGG